MAGEPTEVFDDAAAEAAFSLGFSEEPVQTTTPDTGSEPTAPAEPAPEAAAPVADPAPEPPEYVQLTRKEWTDAQQRLSGLDPAELKRRFDQTNGQLGNFKQRLERLGQAPAVEIKPEDFEELRRDFGDELAPAIAAGVNRALSRQRAAVPAEQAEPAAATGTTTTPSPADAATQAFRQQLTYAAVDAVAGGRAWRTDPAEQQKLAAWVQAQPDEVKGLAKSDDVIDAAELMRLYRKSSDQPATPAKVPAPAPKPVSTRHRTLSAAVNPRGQAGPAPVADEEDHFSQGFKSQL